VVNISWFRIIASLILVNAAGLVLRYFDLDTYAVIIGFRFHLSFVLPLVILYPKNFLKDIKGFFINPVFKGKFALYFGIIFSCGSVLIVLYFLKKIHLGDPDYFYEFGLSSIVDYPVYLLWNFPQFILLFSYLYYCTSKNRKKSLTSLIIVVFLFAYEFVPINDLLTAKEINYIPFAELLAASICAALLFSLYNNIYWFAIVLFSSGWISLLAFGSKNATLVNLLFASQYSEWEGFFTVEKALSQYTFIAQFVILSFLLLLWIPFRKTVSQQTVVYSVSQTESNASIL